MSYQRERDEFISQAAGEGLSVEVARKLLRYATTLQRLSEAQCNGDWPYNGDRDRPRIEYGRGCEDCKGLGTVAPRVHADGCMCSNHDGVKFDDCLSCQGAGKVQTNGRQRIAWDSRYTTCPKCEASGVAKSRMVYSSTETEGRNVDTGNGFAFVQHRVKVCPDCRTQELVENVLREAGAAWANLSEPFKNNSPFTAHFNGDPRGAVLVLSTPNYPWTEDGRGRGLYVPAGGRS